MPEPRVGRIVRSGRGTLEYQSPQPDTVLRLGLAAILVAMLASGIAWQFWQLDGLVYSSWLPGCVFRAWTGVLCPGCGMGHALIHLSRFEWAAALAANPAAPGLTLVMVLGVVRKTPDRATRGWNPLATATCLIVLVAIWLYRVLPGLGGFVVS